MIRHSTIIQVFIFSLLMSQSIFAQQTVRQYLSGIDKDHTVSWEFKVSGGRNSGHWSTIPVPSNWEMQGYGTYHYGSDWYDGYAPDSIGHYRFSFPVPESWREKAVDLVFGGVMTDTEVKINGKLVGPEHQGGFYQFRYAMSKLIKYGETNLLEVKVRRYSLDPSINLAERRTDFWMFSGIYRPVWLEAKPATHIRHLTIDASHDGNLKVNAELENIGNHGKLLVRVMDMQGNDIGDVMEIELDRKQEKAELNGQFEGIQPWSAEWPHRYQMKVALLKEEISQHEIVQKFGFRTVSVREKDGIYINNKKVRFKGVNRHSSWPESGRTLSKELSVMDIQLMKDMNMNAVRMSHYPPDPHFLEMTDSLGMYVIDELTGWQDAYSTPVGVKLVEELVRRDVNHPSIVLWANGNEGGWNVALDNEFQKWDPQNRTVIHPWQLFNHISTTHYEEYYCCTNYFFNGQDIFMPTEFLHGLYDGGHGAGLRDWWELMMSNPLSAGGFLWVFADEGVVRDDQEGAIDVAGNRAPDGILGPYRQKEGSFYAIKEIWSPVHFPDYGKNWLPSSFDGKLVVENRYDFTDFHELAFHWELGDFDSPFSGKNGNTVKQSGKIPEINLAPGVTGILPIDLPTNWRDHQVLYISATDAYGREIYKWSWMIQRQMDVAGSIVTEKPGNIQASEDDNEIRLETIGLNVIISKTTGLLQKVTADNEVTAFNNGPRLISGKQELRTVRLIKENDSWVVKASFEGNLQEVQWKLLPGGWLNLQYTYAFWGNDAPYRGITFDYPEALVTGMTWLGRGPYRVWKNRMDGMEFNVWQKSYNNTVTGISWEYPEFKGYHGDVYWATLETENDPITMVMASEGLHLGIYRPEEAKGSAFDPRSTHIDFPRGDIAIMEDIPPIGTKFHAAHELGPSGKPNMISRRGSEKTVNMYFYFGKQ